MEAYHLDAFTGTSGLTLRDHPEPTPGRSEVLVKVHARSLNYRDLLILQGRYAFPGVAGTIAVSDGAGEVVALGEGVTRVAVGDRVAATYFPRWIDGPLSPSLAVDQFGLTRDGMLAPLVVASEEALVRIPPHLSFEEAATLPCAAVTAWNAVAGPRPIAPGETVLTIGTGGVALFALAFAKLRGARTIVITSSQSKVALLKRLGADDVVNYESQPQWDRTIRDLTEGTGVDYVVETGSVDTLPKSLASTAADGVVSLVAALGEGPLSARATFAGLVTIRRVFVGSRSHFEAMNRAIVLHKLKPVIDRLFTFSEAKLAYEHFEARRHVGKVVIAG